VAKRPLRLVSYEASNDVKAGTVDSPSTLRF
jgi:hypothetical protein